MSTANAARVMPMTNRSHGERRIGSRVGRSPAGGVAPTVAGSVVALMTSL
jgi:hypothetical protein